MTVVITGPKSNQVIANSNVNQQYFLANSSLMFHFMFQLAGCGNRWYKVFEHDENGNPSTTSGDKAELVDAVANGAAIRVRYLSGLYVTSIQNAHIVDDNVCVQAIFSISKSGAFKFQVR